MAGVGRAIRRRAGLGAPVLVLLLALCTAPQALGASPLKLREVFPGSSVQGVGAEYVELQMSADGQGSIAGQDLRFYDAAGNLSLTYTIPADVPKGESQRTVLLASGEALSQAVVSVADFNLGAGADRISPGGGAVCLTGAAPPDCVTWGSIPLATLFNPYLPDGQTANAGAIADGFALRRSIARGCPTYLDAADDSASSAADFGQVAPAPRDNASAPTESRCPPDTAITAFPANPSNQASASFAYAAIPSEPGASFECKLDSQPFAACPNGGKSYSGLAEGSHVFAVRAVGEGGEDPTPKAFAWAIDRQAPETAIDSYPAEPSDGFEAAFAYHSTEPNSSFRCQLDSGAVQLCAAAGKSYFQLADGAHVFRVWATDNAGNQDPTPAERSFTVQNVLGDQTPPDTTIVSAPSNPSPSPSASFGYASNEEGSSFECSLNGAPFAPCPASGIGYSRLRNASYAFSVRAIDRAGNADSVPVTLAWTVAAPLPRAKFTKAPPGRVTLKRGAKAKVRFKFTADKAGADFRCRIDKRAFAPCKPAMTLRVPVGRHRFEVYAIDELGNAGVTPARRIFRVQRKRTNGGLF